tara:strand:+ start:1283 stop:1945 length:663 start_codon:yes stop_codon:yes gene_type:complete
MGLKSNYRPKSWSFSALHNYEACPLQYLLSRTEPVEQEQSWALEYGLHCHSLMENFLNGIIEGVPKELKMFERELTNMKSKNAYAEQELVLDKYWEPICDEGAWRSPDAWIRAKLDARVDNLIVDLKTGREYEHYADQGNLYATMVMQCDPDLDEVDVEFWYTKSGEVASYTFFRSEHEERIALWEERSRKLMREKFWLPKTNIGCRWCAYQDRCELFNA